MAAEGAIGVDVIVKIGGTAVAFQRGAKLSAPMEMVDMTVKTDFPYKRRKPSWTGPFTVDCDCLLAVKGEGGFASLWNTAMAKELIDLVIEIASTGDTLTGKAWMMLPELDGPQDKEGTMSVKFEVDGALTATEGS